MSASHLYWTSDNQDTSEIGRTPVIGGQQFQSISSLFGSPNPHTCGVVSDGTYAYWANRDTASIGREKLSTFGTVQPTEGQWIQLPSTQNETVHPCGIAVDEKYIYWGIYETTHNGTATLGTTIGRALKADGSEATDNFAGGGRTVTGLAISGNTLYTSNLNDGLPGHGSIGRAPLTGGGGEPDFITGLNAPYGIAVDAAGPAAPPPPPATGGGYVPPLIVGCNGCGSGAPPAGSNVPADFSRVWTTNPVFAPASWSTPSYAVAKSATAPKGTVFNYVLDKAGTITILITGTAPGKRIGQKCVAPSHRNVAKRNCSRVTTFATLTRLSRAGHNLVPFSGRIHGRALKPGNYTAVFTAKAATGTATKTKSFAFRITRP